MLTVQDRNGVAGLAGWTKATIQVGCDLDDL